VISCASFCSSVIPIILAGKYNYKMELPGFNLELPSLTTLNHNLEQNVVAEPTAEE
jgi:hypothetical protein